MLQWTPSADIIADGLTKALTRQKHEIFIRHLNLTKLPAS